MRGSKTSLKAKKRSSKPASQDHNNAKTPGTKSMSQCCSKTKMQGSKPASQHHSNAKMQGSRPISSNMSMAKRRAQARVSTANDPCISVITTSITRSSTAYVIRGVNPHYRGVLGDNFTPKTPINNSICYWREAEFLEREENFTAEEY